MRRLVRCAVVLTLFTASPAYARTLGVITSGDDLMHLRDLSPELAAATRYKAIGYHYQTLGILGLDLVRWGGEAVMYSEDDNEPTPADLAGGSIVVSSATYAVLTDGQLDSLGGASVPWRYYFPTGLLLALALVELQLTRWTRRSARTMLVVGGGALVLALVLAIGGVGAASAVPLILGIHHLGIARFTIQRAREEAAEAAEAAAINRAAEAAEAAEASAEEAATDPAPVRRSGPRLASAPRTRPPIIDTDPYRAPPQPPPILVERPPAAAPANAVVVESNAPPPKLLR